VGQHVLWIRSGAGGGRLWCVNGQSAEVEQYWPDLDGHVVSSDGRAVATPGSLATTVTLAGCQG
jgi:hypothetical protein